MTHGGPILMMQIENEYGSYGEDKRLRIIDGCDRAQVFVNGEHIATQYQEQIGEDLFVSLIDGENQLDILVENMSRVNYGHKLLAET